jgi:hypothetical protein
MTCGCVDEAIRECESCGASLCAVHELVCPHCAGTGPACVYCGEPSSGVCPLCRRPRCSHHQGRVQTRSNGQTVTQLTGACWVCHDFESAQRRCPVDANPALRTQFERHRARVAHALSSIGYPGSVLIEPLRLQDAGHLAPSPRVRGWLLGDVAPENWFLQFFVVLETGELFTVPHDPRNEPEPIVAWPALETRLFDPQVASIGQALSDLASRHGIEVTARASDVLDTVLGAADAKRQLPGEGTIAVRVTAEGPGHWEEISATLDCRPDQEPRELHTTQRRPLCWRFTRPIGDITTAQRDMADLLDELRPRLQALKASPAGDGCAIQLHVSVPEALVDTVEVDPRSVGVLAELGGKVLVSLC